MQQIKATVPGSIMLMGEHAVLFGEKALACAVAKYITVVLTPTAGDDVHVDSALAQYHSNLHNLAPEPELSFVVAAIESCADRLPSGFSLKISSEFSHTVGLGSSAAVTAGVVAALSAFAGETLSEDELFQQALAIVHKVQGGRGSGTDLAASIFGAVIAYRVNPREIKRLNTLPAIALYYAGYKTKTPVVLQWVEKRAQANPDLYQQLYQLMGRVTERAEESILKNDWAALGVLMDTYQGLMDALGVSDKAISDMVYSLRQSEQILGVKISGSGLGDCVLTLGDDPDLQIPYEKIPVAISDRGLCIEYN